MADYGGAAADCSLRRCTNSCPQWCFGFILPPPPPLFPDDSSPSLSPLIIALIGILASAVLLVAYYAVVSRFCRRRRSPSFRHQWQQEHHHHQDHHHHHHHHSQQAAAAAPSAAAEGLEERTIQSIAVFRYKKGDGLVVVTECAVCLAEFRDGESLRLLPDCLHAFHLPCIDPWLKTHSSCPSCRTTIGHLPPSATAAASPPPPPPPPPRPRPSPPPPPQPFPLPPPPPPHSPEERKEPAGEVRAPAGPSAARSEGQPSAIAEISDPQRRSVVE